MKLHTELVTTNGKERTRYFIDGVRCTKAQYEKAGSPFQVPSIDGYVDVTCSNTDNLLLECSKDWDSLRKTEVDGVRFCNSCKKTVQMCKTIEEVRLLGEMGMCVAIMRKFNSQVAIASLGIPIWPMPD